MSEIIFGINPIQQLLSNNPARIIEIYISNRKDEARTQKIISLAKQNNISILRFDDQKLEQLAKGENHQGVVAKITVPRALGEADIPDLVRAKDKPLLLILDGVQDPHNLGACLRTADAAGITAVIVPKDNAAPITPTVRKVASGGAESVPFVTVTNLARVLRQLQDLGVWLVGTDSDTETTIYDVDLTGAIGIVMGAEGEGLRQLTKKHCDFIAKIPMLGEVESLNVSVATGVCLYEAVRQRFASVQS